VGKLITQGSYSIVYDGQGLQTWVTDSGTTTGYAFHVMSGGKIVGEYHIHPNGKRMYSGNFRLFANNSFGNLMVGQARNWQWLCDKVADQVTG